MSCDQFDSGTVEKIICITITEVVQPFIELLMVLASLIFIYGVIEFITNTDNEKSRTQGKKHMLWGIVGLFIMIAAAGIMWVLVRFWQNV